ncbi:MAG TPA: SPOR domain-containing protein [Bacteroidia bacterium]|nr:SPOR domain-containing protein [Bacteroidia bacterium]
MNIFRTLFSSIIFIFLCKSICAQTAISDTGKVEVVQEYKVKELVNKHIEINSKAPIKGYRIKIHFGSDKNKAKEIKAKFISKFPDISAYEKYDQPNFNIRVGDFRTKLEAYKALKEIQVEFPSSFLVQDEIEMPKLYPSEKK